MHPLHYLKVNVSQLDFHVNALSKKSTVWRYELKYINNKKILKLQAFNFVSMSVVCMFISSEKFI